MNTPLKLKLPAITPGPWLLQDESFNGDKARLTVFSETASRAMQKWHRENPDKPKGGFSNGTNIASAHVLYNGSGEEHGPPMIMEAEEMHTNAAACTAVPDLLEALLLAHDFLEDLRTSNPGYLAKLTLQDYARLNDLGKIPAALRKAGCTETTTVGGAR